MDHPAGSDERNGENFVGVKINLHKGKEIAYKTLRVTIITELNKQLKGRNMKREEENAPKLRN